MIKNTVKNTITVYVFTLPMDGNNGQKNEDITKDRKSYESK